MPAHNEAAYLETAVRDVHEGLRALGVDFELLVVENGSSDDTLAIAGRLADRYPNVSVSSRPVANYGAALREGIIGSRGEFVVTFDVDYYELRFVEQALALLKAGDEAPVIVVASKRASGSRDERPWPRRFVTATFGLMLLVGFSLSVSETHGMKMMRRAPVETLLRQCRLASDLSTRSWSSAPIGPGSKWPSCLLAPRSSGPRARRSGGVCPGLWSASPSCG